MSDTPAAAEELLEFWLGPLDEHGFSDEAHRKRWFEKNAAFDETLRERFGELHARGGRGELDEWKRTARGRLALVILLDQLSRNLFRDTPAMYDQDDAALAIAREAIDAGDEEELAPQERYFLYMPFMHAEDRDAQERCVTLFEQARATVPAELADRFDPKWAVMHRDIVARFGRFPHRNELLDRESTDDEREFLTEPGSSF
ncbi:MAG: DUF924 domain-containing protein [Deltaproteobacteria bacterium]|nr:DUF924 domain-containing protein [Deltaproteobacteria bacterium]